MPKGNSVMKLLTVPGPCAFLIGFLFLIMPAQAGPKKISEAQAVKVAEQFIVDNGYTKAKPRPGSLAPESLNRGHSRDAELNLRHDSLEPHAYGVFEGGNFGGWGVVFEHSHRVLELAKNLRTVEIDPATKEEKLLPPGRPTGRVLMMDATGKKCMIMHKDFFLDNEFKHLKDDKQDKPADK